MDKRDEAFLEKATKLIDEYKKLESDPRSGTWNTEYGDERKLLRNDMVHLLYSYDPNQPSFVKIKQSIEHSGFAYDNDIVKCLEYTIHYIKEVKI